MKVIKSLENRGILLKGTTRKITSQEGGFSNFLRPLMTAGLPLMRTMLTPLAKCVLLPLRLSAGMSAADADKSLEEYGLIIKGIIETIKNEKKKRTKRRIF